jgi:hypothetical protein
MLTDREVAFRLLALLGMTLPAIAIVAHIAANKCREEIRALQSFFITLISLSLLLIAAILNIFFVFYYHTIYILIDGAIIFYVASLSLLVISIIVLYLAYKK